MKYLSKFSEQVRRSPATMALKKHANKPVIGKGIRWAARMLRKGNLWALRQMPENVAHDKRQIELLKSYQSGLDEKNHS